MVKPTAVWRGLDTVPPLSITASLLRWTTAVLQLKCLSVKKRTFFFHHHYKKKISVDRSPPTAIKAKYFSLYYTSLIQEGFTLWDPRKGFYSAWRHPKSMGRLGPSQIFIHMNGCHLGVGYPVLIVQNLLVHWTEQECVIFLFNSNFLWQDVEDVLSPTLKSYESH